MKILALSDSPTLATGYGRVAGALLPELSRVGFAVKTVGRGFRGEEHPYPFEIVGHEPSDPLAMEPTKRLIREWQPDIVLSIGDIWMVDFLPKVEGRNTFQWMAYFSLDGGPIPREWQDTIRDMDYPVVFSGFSLDLVRPVTDKPVELIYHGVDSRVFVPLEFREELKTEAGLDGRFLVGCVARNQPRKNLPALLRAYARFVDGKTDVGLYLHTSVGDPVGWDLSAILHRFGIEKSTYFTTGVHDAQLSVPDEIMVKIYNLFDVFVLPSFGEGFGLPILESQSCGVPVLVTDYSACPELVVDPVELLPVKTLVIMNPMGIDQALVDEDALVARLEHFYRDWKENGSRLIRQLGEQGRRLAEGMPWSDAAERFIRLIRRVERQDSPPPSMGPGQPFLKVGRRLLRNYQVFWHGIVHDATGYSQVSRQSLFALDRVGMDIHVAPLDRGTKPTDLDPGERAALARLAESPTKTNCLLTVHLQPDVYRQATVRFPHKMRIGFTVWETDRLPVEWVEACNDMDAMIVPSRFNMEVFAESGVKVPIHVARHGVDPARFHPSEERFDFGEELPGCRFLSVFSWQYRKGVDILLETFLREFTVRDDVCLILKTSGLASTRDAWQLIQQRVAGMHLAHEPAPVYVTAEELTTDQLRALYNTATCLVLPSRGEGVGLPFLEAAAHSLPSIAPGWGGQTDFLTEKNAFLLEGKLVPVDERQANFAWFRGGMNWFETNPDHLAHLLRTVYSDPQQAKKRGEQAFADVIPAWTWDQTVWDLVGIFDTVWRGGP